MVAFTTLISTSLSLLFVSQVFAVTIPAVDPNLIPGPCISTCQDFGNIASACPDFGCVCTNANGLILAKCVDCVINNNKQVSIPDGQTVLDKFVDGCNTLGDKVQSQKAAAKNGAVKVLSGMAGATGVVLAGFLSM